MNTFQTDKHLQVFDAEALTDCILLGLTVSCVGRLEFEAAEAQAPV
jgi:hypothetical protein